MKTYNELVLDLQKIKELGYIKTHRSGDTGIGKTLEDLLNIKENNFAGPDAHHTELKSARKGSQSMLTLFTKSPLPKGINSELVEKFGEIQSNGSKKLHSTLSANSKNSLYGREGFTIDTYNDRIELGHSDYDQMKTPYWGNIDLEKSFNHKYAKNLLYVKADHKGHRKNEEFHYNEAWLMHGFSFENFIKLIKDGEIKIDIRLGRNPDNSLHDHGTGFRIKQQCLNLCFKNQQRVM